MTREAGDAPACFACAGKNVLFRRLAARAEILALRVAYWKERALWERDGRRGLLRACAARRRRQIDARKALRALGARP